MGQWVMQVSDADPVATLLCYAHHFARLVVTKTGGQTVENLSEPCFAYLSLLFTVSIINHPDVTRKS